MPMFRITVTNQTFRSSDDHECPSLDDARRHGVGAALDIGTGEVIDGKPFFGAEVRVEKGEETLSRFVVSVGSSPLQ